MGRIANFESDRVAMIDVLFDLHKQCLSVQHDFNLLDEKLNDLKTDSKSYIMERLELVEADIHESTRRSSDLPVS